MAKRYVDANVLEGLAHDMQSARGTLEETLNRCEWRVNSAPRRGWDYGTWWDARNSLRSELILLEDDRRVLVNRAARVRIAAAVAKSMLPPILLPLVLPLVLVLPPVWKEALHRLGADGKPAGQPVKPAPTVAKQQGVGSAAAEAEKRAAEAEKRAAEAARQAEVIAMRKRIASKALEYDGKYAGPVYDGHHQCVALISTVVKEVFPHESVIFGEGNAPGAWTRVGDGGSKHIFGNGKRWKKIDVKKIPTEGGYQAGDIVFYQGRSHPNGHVAIVVEVNGELKVVEQNAPLGSKVKVSPLPSGDSDVIGVVRFNSIE